MTLDNFRTIELIWDKVNKSIIKTIKTASSDTTGRYFSVKVLDEGQEVDLTGAKLQLYWEHPNFNTTGTDDFVTINNGGLFRLSFSNEMLTNVGSLNAYLVLEFSEGKITSDKFEIKVFKGAINGAVVPSNGDAAAIKAVEDALDKLKFIEEGAEVVVLGEGDIATNNLKDKAVTPDKTTFFKYTNSQNTLDRTKTVHGEFVSNTDGTFASSSTYERTNYLAIDKTKINIIISRTSNASGARYAIKDSDGNFTKGEIVTNWQPIVFGGTVTRYYYTIPIAGNYASIAISFLDNENNVMLEFTNSSTPTNYTEYQAGAFILDESYLPDVNGTDIVDRSITAGKLNFEIPETVSTKNIANQKYLVADHYVNQATGDLAANASHDTYDKIPITQNTTYTVSGYSNNLRVVYSKLDGSFLSGEPFPANATFTTPTNASLVTVSFTATDPSLVQIEQGATATSFVKSGYTLPDLILEDEADNLYINLPDTLYGVVGQELNIYFDNILSGRDTDYLIEIICGKGRQYEHKFQFIPDVQETRPLTINVYDKSQKLLGSKSTNIVVKALSVGGTVTKTALFIGDSTTNANTPSVKLLENFNQTDDPMAINLIGTRGTTPALHEGRGGWTAKQYCTVASSGTYTNAFWNAATSKFDFANYMTTNGYSNLDYVFINLGINDMFNPKTDEEVNASASEALTYFDEMVASIRAYSATIKIGIAITIPPNYSKDSFARPYGSPGNTRINQTRDRYKRNNILWVDKLIAHFKGRTSELIYLVPIHTNIDTIYNYGTVTESPNARNTDTQIALPAYNGGVHPADSGYWQVADVYWYWIKSFES